MRTIIIESNFPSIAITIIKVMGHINNHSKASPGTHGPSCKVYLTFASSRKDTCGFCYITFSKHIRSGDMIPARCFNKSEEIATYVIGRKGDEMAHAMRWAVRNGAALTRWVHRVSRRGTRDIITESTMSYGKDADEGFLYCCGAVEQKIVRKTMRCYVWWGCFSLRADLADCICSFHRHHPDTTWREMANHSICDLYFKQFCKLLITAKLGKILLK